MATYRCHAPYRRHATRQIASAEALSLLSDYLAAASADASLHPNALLAEAGPTISSSGPHEMGLVLHNLKHVEAGLEGKQLAIDITLDLNGESERAFEAPGLGTHEVVYGNGEGSVNEDHQWQDKAEFEREQEIMQGEIGDRDNAVGDEGDEIRVPSVRVEGTMSAADKEARKRNKKERRLNDRHTLHAKQELERQSET